MKITYVDHSSFLLEEESFYLLFDYFQGEIPMMDKAKKLYVFSSHAHHDHFSFKVFDKVRSMEEVTYIFSKDIRKKFNKNYFLKEGISEETYESIYFLKEYESYQDENIEVKTFKSTDEGVAFAVLTQRENIYHAGDLNWWTWPGETTEDAKRREETYKKEIEMVKEYSFDLAFLPLDPRQKERFYLGFDWFAKRVDAKQLIPMHMWGDFSVVDLLKQKECSESYRQKISFS